MEDLIVRAIDLGFGNVKYVTSHAPGGAMKCGIFPSLAPLLTSSTKMDDGVVAGERQNIFKIDVDGEPFIVGRDVDQFVTPTTGHLLGASYSKSKDYVALFKGALAYMGEERIDMLVLGLPVNTHGRYADVLKAMALGKHVVPNIRRNIDPEASEMLTVTVEDVYVMQQPMGGLFDHFVRNGMLTQLKSQISLLVDAGFFTLDWVTATKGKLNPNRSNACDGGMSAALKAIAGRIAVDFDTQFSDTTKIDEAIRSGGLLSLSGKPYDISEYIPLGKAVARKFVSAMANNVGDGIDIDNIVLSGGGAHFFLDLVQEKYPRHEVVLAKAPVFANVRGFQLAGEDLAQRKKQASLSRAA